MTMPQPPRRSFLTILRELICRRLCGDQQEPPKPDQTLISFVPGHVNILAEFPSHLDLKEADIIARIQSKLDQVRQADPDARELFEKVILVPERVKILRGQSLTLASVFGDVPGMRLNPNGLFRFISRLHQDIHKAPLDEGTTDGGGQTEGSSGEGDYGSPSSGPGQLPLRAAGRPRLTSSLLPPRVITPDADGFDIRAASPNWLSTGAKYIVGGGPGARPIEELSPTGLDLSLPDELSAPETSVQPVEVAILDTAPDNALLLSAYDQWVGNDIINPPVLPSRALNPRLKSLLSNATNGTFDTSPTGQLEIVYSLTSGGTVPPISVQDHEYAMSSHGLFIAGIIRQLAPHAKLRLIRVLNDDCGGTLESITAGLQLLVQPVRPTPLIVNCSFVLTTPRTGDQPPPVDVPDQAQADEIAGLSQTLRDTLTQIGASNAIVVAAAGNGGHGGNHPLTRFPAAYPNVVGVAALDDDDDLTPPALAEFSDLADDQAEEGFATFGGGADSGTTPPVADNDDGMIGAFVDPWPVPSFHPNAYDTVENTSGMARWAGTSFATPIIVAALANRVSNGDDLNTAFQNLTNNATVVAGVGKVIETGQG